jgi:thiol-disulfide isomerase/thioredoxin
MKFTIAFFSLFLFAFFQEKPIPVVDFKGLEPYLSKRNDTTYIINFWATWCAPCVKELPNFEKLNEIYKSKKVKVILVSLDFYKNYKSTLIPFIARHNLKSDIILLHDINSNEWIDKVDKSWSGAIPVTLIYNKSSRSFYEQTFTYNQLDSVLNIKLKQNQ